jgi:predicted nucleotidyltransferase
MLPDLSGLLRSLVEADVSFVVIGGIAVAAHAAVRATEDVDVVPDPARENVARLLDLLDRLEARLVLNPARGIDARVRELVHQGRNLTVTTKLGDLDVVQSLPGVPAYEELATDAVVVELHDVRFRVASREHLIAMKRARGSALDQADLERLTAGD